MEPEELIAELENKHTGEALSIDEYSRIFAALREYKRVLDKARMVVAAVEIDPTTLDVSETPKRYAVEILYPNGAWVVIGTVNVEPGQAVQVTVRVREMVD